MLIFNTYGPLLFPRRGSHGSGDCCRAGASALWDRTVQRESRGNFCFPDEEIQRQFLEWWSTRETLAIENPT